jgi:hypothetical protein
MNNMRKHRDTILGVLLCVLALIVFASSLYATARLDCKHKRLARELPYCGSRR